MCPATLRVQLHQRNHILNTASLVPSLGRRRSPHQHHCGTLPTPCRARLRRHRLARHHPRTAHFRKRVGVARSRGPWAQRISVPVPRRTGAGDATRGTKLCQSHPRYLGHELEQFTPAPLQITTTGGQVSFPRAPTSGTVRCEPYVCLVALIELLNSSF